jgi:hypothetical protein
MRLLENSTGDRACRLRGAVIHEEKSRSNDERERLAKEQAVLTSLKARQTLAWRETSLSERRRISAQARADATAARGESTRRAAAVESVRVSVEKSGGGTLHLAAALGDIPALVALLDAGADTTECNNAGDTPLHLAARGRHTEAVRTLLPSSPWAAVNKAKRTAVEDAVLSTISKRDGTFEMLEDATALVVREALQAVQGQPSSDASRIWAAKRALDGYVCSVLDTLMGMTGLRRVKQEALYLYDSVRLDLQRDPDARSQSALNFVFVGNPGAGKTTVARLFGALLDELKMREKGTFVETTGKLYFTQRNH